MDLSVVIVTSPSKSNPAITLIEQVVNSLHNNVSGVQDAQIIIVMDGFEVFDKARTKKGRITNEMVLNYEEYYINLLAKYSSPQVKIVRLESHHGFAMAVKEGLLHCTTTFSLILQHDRIFCVPFAHLAKVCQVMEENLHIRYVGFPTVMSKNHQKSLHCRYSLLPLVDPAQSHIEIYPNELALHPLIFWYDSNHIAHVERYLQIYKPYHYLSVSLRDALGLVAIKKMLLRRGDFIEDRFGQQQRNQLSNLKDQESLLKELFEWYGCYLLWYVTESTMVVHLRGRHFDPVMDLLREEARGEEKEKEEEGRGKLASATRTTSNTSGSSDTSSLLPLSSSSSALGEIEINSETNIEFETYRDNQTSIWNCDNDSSGSISSGSSESSKQYKII